MVVFFSRRNREPDHRKQHHLKKEPHIKILNNGIRQTVEKVGQGHQWIFHNDTDPKFSDQNMNVLKRPSQSPDYNQTEHLQRSERSE